MSLLRILYHRQPLLAVFGWLMLALTAAGLVLQSIDPRQLDGVEVWVKPTKFFFSVAVLYLTTAWFFGYVRPENRNRPAMLYVVWMLLVFGCLEDAWIAWQAAHGLASHFNTSTRFFSVMYTLMGILAVLGVSTFLPLAWEIARRPVANLRPDYRFAVVTGLVLSFVLGGGAGIYMGSQDGHAIGIEGGHFPIFGWNRLGGDLRVPHFFGVHMEQGLPLLAAAIATWPAPVRWFAIVMAAVIGTALAVYTFGLAITGQPFLPGLMS